MPGKLKYYNSDCISFRLNDYLNVGLAETYYNFKYSYETKKNTMFTKKEIKINEGMCNEIKLYLDENFNNLYELTYLTSLKEGRVKFNYCFIENVESSEVRYFLMTETDYKRSFEFCNKNLKSTDKQIDFYFEKYV